jgi:hypothetical protein
LPGRNKLPKQLLPLLGAVNHKLGKFREDQIIEKRQIQTCREVRVNVDVGSETSVVKGNNDEGLVKAEGVRTESAYLL